MRNEHGPEFNPSDRVQRLFETPRPFELTKFEMEQHDILAVGPIGEKGFSSEIKFQRHLDERATGARKFIDDYITQFIVEENNRRRVKGAKPIENWPKLRISDLQVKDGRCRLVFEKGVTSYPHLLAFGSEESLREVYDRYASEDPSGNKISFDEFKHLFAPAVPGTEALVLTSDNKIILQKRNPAKVGTYGKAWHVPGGNVDEGDKDQNGQVNPVITIKRELNEELGIPLDQISNINCVLISLEKKNGYVAFSFTATTPLTSEQILKLKGDGEGDISLRRMIVGGNISKILPALLRADKLYSSLLKEKKDFDLTVPTSRALFFVLDKLLR